MTLLQAILLLLVLVVVATFAYRKGRSATSQQTATPPAKPTGTAASNAGPAVAPPVSSGGRAPDPTAVARRTTSTTAPPPVAATKVQPRAAQGGAMHVASWGYQLQNLDIGRAAASPFDLLVIDYAKDGSDDTALKPAELARLKQKPDGSRRLVLAYLSIGEAESYRSYWNTKWKRDKPGWLLAENPEWKENYAVCFWEPEWQGIMCGSPASRLDLILKVGFDGVYLDKCDVFEDLERLHKREFRTRPNIQGDMVAFVQRIAAHAKSQNPNFLVIMQNAEMLIEDPNLRRAIDGVAKEELLYGIDTPERKNGADDVTWSRERLDLIKNEGKMVLVVEYLQNQAKIQDAARTVGDLGYVLYIAPKDRELARLNYETLQA
jgi:cysteinyl-tRNA synthetase, unknown class